MAEPKVLRLGNGPYKIVIDDSDFVYVSGKKSNSIVIVDGVNDEIVRKLFAVAPSDMLINYKSKEIYAMGDKTITIIDGIKQDFSSEGNKHEFSVKSDGHMAIDSSKNQTYLIHDSRFHPKIDVLSIKNDFDTVKSLNVRRHPVDLTFGTKTGNLYVTNKDCTVSVINPEAVEMRYEIDKSELLLKCLGSFDRYPKRILVNELENRIYVLYTSLFHRVPPITTYMALGRSEVLVVYDTVNREPLNFIHCLGLNDFCINYVNSQVYLASSEEEKLLILDKDGLTSSSSSLMGPGYRNTLPRDTESGTIISPTRSAHDCSLEVNANLHKLYLAVRGAIDNYLLIYNLDEISVQ